MSPRLNKSIVMALTLVSVWMATSAASCSEDLKSATEGLNAVTAKCSELSDFAKAAEFDRASAEAANRSDQSVDQTTVDAGAAREKRCAASANPSYEPYGDVQVDLMR